MTDTFAIQLNCGHTVRHQGRAPVVMDPWWCPFGDLSTLVASVWQTDESGANCLGMTRTERRRRAIAAAIRFAHDDPLAYDQAADRGDLRDRIVQAVDDHLDAEGAA